MQTFITNVHNQQVKCPPVPGDFGNARMTPVPLRNKKKIQVADGIRCPQPPSANDGQTKAVHNAADADEPAIQCPAIPGFEED